MKKTTGLLLAFAAALPLSVQSKSLSINNQEYAVDTMVVKHTVGPGVTYAYYRVPGRPADIHVLEIDVSNPYINLEVWNGGQAAVATETPSAVGRRYAESGVDVVAVHNGDFFTTGLGEVGISRMGLVGAGECLFNPTGQPLFCMDNDRMPRIDYVNFAGSVTRSDGVSARVHTVNQLHLEWDASTHADQLSLYTPAFGQSMHSTSIGGKVAVLRPRSGSNTYTLNTTMTMEVVSVAANTGSMSIPADGSLLHGVGSSEAFLDMLVPGQEVTLSLTAVLPSYPEATTVHDAIGGSGHIILRNGEITNINNPDCHPRTFMGISQDCKTVYSVVVDGRTGSSAGIDLDDQGRVLQWLGAWDGINLDGGGSSCMVVNGTIRNHPSDGNERSVGNGVLLYSSAPKDDRVASIEFEPSDWRLPAGAVLSPRVFGFNRYSYMVDGDVTDVTLTCDDALGAVSTDGRTFIASVDAAEGYLTATTPEGLQARVKVTVAKTQATADVTDYIIDNRRDYKLKFTSAVGAQTYPVDASTMTWTTDNAAVATVTDGRVRGVSNGTTVLHAVSDHFSGDITVTTENVDGGTRNVFHGVPATGLTLKQTGGTGLTAVSEGNGYTLTYTGNGTARGSYIQIGGAEGTFATYGLPESIVLTINPGDAPVNQIFANYIDARGNRGSLTFAPDKLTPGTTATYTVSLADVMDISDNSLYPITFQGLRLSMGTSAKATQYTVSIPEFKYVYDATDAVGNITVDNPENRPEADVLYNLDGTKAPAYPAPGIYVRGDGTKIVVR